MEGAHGRVCGVAEQSGAAQPAGGAEVVVKVEAAAPHRLRAASKGFEAEFGLSMEEVSGRSFRVVCGPSTNLLRLNSLLKNAELGAQAEGLLVLYDKACNKKVVQVSVSSEAQDFRISMRTVAARELKPSLAEDGQSKAVLNVADKLAIQYASPELARLFGLEQAQLLRRKINVFYGPSTSVRTVFQLLSAAERGQEQSARVSFWDVNCAEVFCNMHVAPVMGPDAEVTHLLVFVDKVEADQEVETKEEQVQEQQAAEPETEVVEQAETDVQSAKAPEEQEQPRAQKRARRAEKGEEAEELQGLRQVLTAKRACQYHKGARCLLAMVPALICMQQCVQPLAASDAMFDLPRSRTTTTLFGTEKVMQHYRDVAPPLTRRRSLVFEEKMLRSHGSHETAGSIKGDRAENAVLILDLDKTTIYGNDGNDLGIALQWMEKPVNSVKDLYGLLLNPNVKAAYEDMRAKADNVEVVIYTRRPQILEYRSCFRHARIDVQYADWHHDGELYIPETVESAEEMMNAYKGPELLEDEQTDILKSMERLIAARDAVWNELGLITPPSVVVTAQDKHVDRIMDRLGLPADNAFLFDDNDQLEGADKVVLVEGFEALPIDRRNKVMNFMNKELPVSEIDEDLIEYLEGAKPEERAVERDDKSGKVQWRVPLADKAAKPWQMPTLKPRKSSNTWERASATGLDVAPWKKVPALKQEPGCISPITPSSEDVEHSRTLPADLKVAAEKAFKLRMTSV
mmetsp:Transcript_5060/g.8138  ORF Transcript_5060/g.8138 Transcript_5060/m.8138 type:complete len:742 (+) Transcript_5060:95-2320(+)